jgi:hypothetical protein
MPFLDLPDGERSYRKEEHLWQCSSSQKKPRYAIPDVAKGSSNSTEYLMESQTLLHFCDPTEVNREGIKFIACRVPTGKRPSSQSIE